MDKARQFPELDRPPIDEVVCGIGFAPVGELDPLALGVYWGLRAKEYPKRSLLPAISDEAGFRIGAVPMRAFLVNVDDQFVLQLQNDRIFMNWRNRGRGYPRFSERHGEYGLLRRAIREYEAFEGFVRERFDRVLQPRRIDLTKIDMLRRGAHWKDLADLAKLLPVSAALDRVKRSDRRHIDLRFVEDSDAGRTMVHLASVATQGDGAEPDAVRMEFRLTQTIRKTSLSDAFNGANEVLNDAFFTLLDASELDRFRSKGEQK